MLRFVLVYRCSIHLHVPKLLLYLFPSKRLYDLSSRLVDVIFQLRFRSLNPFFFLITRTKINQTIIKKKRNEMKHKGDYIKLECRFLDCLFAKIFSILFYIFILDIHFLLFQDLRFFFYFLRNKFCLKKSRINKKQKNYNTIELNRIHSFK